MLTRCQTQQTAATATTSLCPSCTALGASPIAAIVILPAPAPLDSTLAEYARFESYEDHAPARTTNKPQSAYTGDPMLERAHAILQASVADDYSDDPTTNLRPFDLPSLAHHAAAFAMSSDAAAAPTLPMSVRHAGTLPDFGGT